MNTITKEVIKANENLSEIRLLNWAMNQLFRAARTLDILAPDGNDNIAGNGCDATATVILKRLIKSKRGWNLVSKTNPKLLRGYKKPTQ